MSADPARRDALIEYVGQLHATVDALVAPLVARHADRLSCRRGCSGCCADGLTVTEVEAARISATHADLLQGAAPHPPGACAFLDADGACRIYASRPYVCRTQGLPLRWAEERAGQVVEARDICPLNAEGEPLDALPADACWTLGPVEQRLAAAQAAWGEPDARVALRDLFGAASG